MSVLSLTKLLPFNTNTKDFLYFTAKLQETPNLWQVFNQKTVYEVATDDLVKVASRHFRSVRLENIGGGLCSAVDILRLLMITIVPTGFKQVYQIRMLTILPAYRRRGLAVLLVEKAIDEAHDQGYSVIRMDCINSYDYKIAEKCNLQCIVRFPLHKMRGTNAPYIKRNSEHNRYVRVYVDVRVHPDIDINRADIKRMSCDLESLME